MMRGYCERLEKPTTLAASVLSGVGNGFRAFVDPLHVLR